MDVRACRQEIGFTLRDVANEAGHRSISYASEFERGIKAATLSIAKAYYRLSDGKINLLDDIQ